MNNFYNPYLYASGGNTFVGHYINDYSEVLNTAVPMNGEAVLFANLEQGMIWSKKIQGNVPVIQPYKITPIFQETNKDTDIFKRLEALEKLIMKEDSNNGKLESD